MNKRILAHRGLCSQAPENTKLAFDLALLLNFDGVELDIHQTKDNKIVIIHDETTLRTSNKNLKIQESTLEELKELNFAYKWNVFRKKKEKILTLEEFLDLYLGKFKYINIEIKTDVVEYLNIEKNLFGILNQRKEAKKKIILSSFNFLSLEKFYELSHEYKLGFLWWKIRDFAKVNKTKIKKMCSYLHPWINLYDIAKEKSKYNKLDLPYSLWTIKNKKHFDKYINDDKVKFIISNYKF